MIDIVIVTVDMDDYYYNYYYKSRLAYFNLAPSFLLSHMLVRDSSNLCQIAVTKPLSPNQIILKLFVSI